MSGLSPRLLVSQYFVFCKRYFVNIFLRHIVATFLPQLDIFMNLIIIFSAAYFYVYFQEFGQLLHGHWVVWQIFCDSPSKFSNFFVNLHMCTGKLPIIYFKHCNSIAGWTLYSQQNLATLFFFFESRKSASSDAFFTAKFGNILFLFESRKLGSSDARSCHMGSWGKGLSGALNKSIWTNNCKLK